MASAASKVFAITELLERILLHDSLSTKDVFVFQRIDRKASQVIGGSFHLQRKLHLRHLTELEWAVDGAQTLPINWYLLGVEPFWQEFATSERPLANICTIHFSHIAAEELGEVQNVQHVEGYRRFKGTHPTRTSWSDMKLTPNPCPAEVEVKIRHRDKRGNRHTHPVWYTDVFTLEAGDATLGNLIRVLEEVKMRSFAEHEKLAKVRHLTPRRFGELGHADCLMCEQEHEQAPPDVECSAGGVVATVAGMADLRI
ncbi:hypothetical protein LTR36_006662 [Oleoguttula mirabilis]|uniref:Uncharacterized protein n=1 Tax=Oleoguttula mirabilis TaxID=1507867 RepID=A0AAV9JBP6_9PEZI|nr:hypothetical protein LTR36_006662 [Oleoguttula mirabilis]